MVDLSGGSEGPLEHAFSNSVFIIPGIIVISLSDFCGIIEFYYIQGINVRSPRLKIVNWKSEKIYFKHFLEQKMAENEEQGLPIEEGLKISSMIGEKLTESIQNMDLLNVLQKMVATTPEDEESEEIRDKLRGVLNKFQDMTSEDKARFAAQIKEGLSNKLSMRLKENAMLAGVEDAIKSAVMTKLYMVAAGVLLLIFLFVFFGYKLYKSIKEKEKKREEKKKAKQMKKKK